MAKQLSKAKPKTQLKTTPVPEIPVKVTVEVIIRNETLPKSNFKNLMLADAPETGDCPDNKFTFTFERENASVLSLIVGGYSVDNPEDNGKFTTCIYDPSPEPKVRVIALAKEDAPGGRIALTMTFLGKNLFKTPQEFTHAGNGFLKLHVVPKLPLS